MKPFLGKGLPELNVPPMEPLFVDQLSMDNDAGAVRIKALFSDILAKGASNYTIKEVRSDVRVSAIVQCSNTSSPTSPTLKNSFVSSFSFHISRNYVSICV